MPNSNDQSGDSGPTVIQDTQTNQNPQDTVGQIVDLLDLDFSGEPAEPVSAPIETQNVNGGLTDIMDILNLGTAPVIQNQVPVQNQAPASNSLNNDIFGLSSAPPQAAQSGNDLDIFGLGGGIGAAPAISVDINSSYVAPMQQWMDPNTAGKGCEVQGTFERSNGQIKMNLTLTNHAMAPVSGFAVQFNKNSFGVTIQEPMNIPHPIQPNTSANCSITLQTSGQVQKMNPINQLQVALKNKMCQIMSVTYWACQMPLHVFLTEDGKMDGATFVKTWQEIPSTHEKTFQMNNWMDTESSKIKLERNNIFMINSRVIEGQELCYFSMKLTNNLWVLAEVKCPGQVTIKCRAIEICDLVNDAFQGIL